MLFPYAADEDLFSFCCNHFYVLLFYDNHIYFPFVLSASYALCEKFLRMELHTQTDLTLLESENVIFGTRKFSK